MCSREAVGAAAVRLRQKPSEPVARLMQLPRRRWWTPWATICGLWRRRSPSCSRMARAVRSPSIRSAGISVVDPR